MPVKRKFGCLRMLLFMFGLSWVLRPDRPLNDEDRARLRDRRHRLRQKVRQAAREFLTEEGTEA